jgi:PAS domain S-box-containing protein
LTLLCICVGLLALVLTAFIIFRPTLLSVGWYPKQILPGDALSEPQTPHINKQKDLQFVTEEETNQKSKETAAIKEKQGERVAELQAQINAIHRNLCVAELDTDGRITKINSVFLSLLDYEADEIIGKTITDFIDVDFSKSPEYLRIVLNTRKEIGANQDIKIKGKHKKEIWINTTINPILSEGELFYKIILLAHDITVQKTQNLAYKTKIKAIENFNAIVEFSLDGTILHANDIFLEMMGYSIHEIQNKNHYLFLPNDLDKAIYDKLWQEVLNGVVQHGEFERKRKNGQKIWISASYSLITDRKGETLRIIKFARDVTNRKITEQQLTNTLDRLSYKEAQLEEAQEIANIGSWHFDIESKRFTWSNQTYIIHDLPTSHLSFTFEQYIKLIHPDDLKMFLNNFALMRYKNFHKFIYKIITKKNHTRILEATTKIELGDIGEAKTFFGTLMDVTEREMVNRELKEKNIQLKDLSLIASNTDNAIIIVNDKGLISWVNEAFTLLTEYTAEEAIGKNPRDFLIGRDTSQEVIKYIIKSFFAEQYFKSELVNYTKSGNLFWITLNATPVFNERKNLAQYIVILNEITERKNYELKLREANEELSRLSLVANKTDNAVIITDKHGAVTWVNDGFTRITEYSLAEVIHQKPGAFLQGANTSERDVDIIRFGLSSLYPFNAEILNYTKSGKPYWISLNITPVFDKNGELEQYIAIESDISDKKKIEIELKAKNEEITASITYAKRIQAAILPSKEKINQSLSNYFIFYKPRDIVSGDFYWFAKVHSKDIIAAIDCTGHGVPGAFMSMIGNDLLNEIVVSREITAPHLILNELNAGVISVLRQRETLNTDGMEMALCAINEQEGILEYAGAKNPLYLIQHNTLTEVKGDKFGIGGWESGSSIEKRFTKHTFSFTKEPHSPIVFYIFSDGYQDQFGKNRRKFMKNKMRELLYSLHLLEINQQQDLLSQALAEWQQDEDQTDDILVIGVKIN